MRLRTTLAVLAGLLAGMTGPLFGQSKRQQVCSAYASVTLPDEASVAAPAIFPVCESYRSYAGIERAVNYAAARECAWRERAAQQADLRQNPQAPTAWVVGGDAILVNLYANGLGVSRNVPLAIRLACEEKAGLAADGIESLGKLAELPGKPEKRFEICDDAATTFTMNFCSGYQSELAEKKRSRAFGRLSAGWTAEQKALFAELEKAEKRYTAAHIRELDQSGTIHTIRDAGSEAILDRNFLLDVRKFEEGGIPGAADAQHVEQQMRQQYEKNLATARAPAATGEEGTAVTADGVAEAQAAWERYRAAWVAFAAVRYPAVQASAVRAYLARERLALLIPMGKQIYRP